MTNSQPSNFEDNLNNLANLLTQTAQRTIDNENNIARLTEVYISDREIILQLAFDRARLHTEIEALVETQRNQQDTISQMLQIQQSFSSTQQSHQAYIEQTIARIDRAIVRIDAVQAEIRGLQTENRRIIDRVFGEQTE